MGNTSPKDMDSLLPLMNMVIYSIDKVKKLRLNREVSSTVSDVQTAQLLLCLDIGVKRPSGPPCLFRANRRPTGTGPVWRRTSWNRLTLSVRRLPRPAERRRREPRRRGSWTRKTLRDSVVWRSEIWNAAHKPLKKSRRDGMLPSSLVIFACQYILFFFFFRKQLSGGSRRRLRRSRWRWSRSKWKRCERSTPVSWDAVWKGGGGKRNKNGFRAPAVIFFMQSCCTKWWSSPNLQKSLKLKYKI